MSAEPKSPTEEERARAEQAIQRAVSDIEKELVELAKVLPEWTDMVFRGSGRQFVSIDHQREIRMQSEGVGLVPAIKNTISVRAKISYRAVYLLRG
jgi:hypothetical protein